MQRSLMTLALALILALAAAAQQSPSSSTQNPPPGPAASTQPQAPADQAPAQQEPAASSNASSTQTAADQEPPMPKMPDKVQYRKEGFWGHLNPFARKKYVQNQVTPVRDAVNELDDVTAENGKMIRDTDERAQAGIRLASAHADEANQHAQEANQHALAANQTAQQASQQLQTVSKAVDSVDQYRTATQMEIRFRAGQVVLSKHAKDALDEMAQPLKDQKGYVIQVQGYARGRGQAAIQASQELAQSVVRYLVLNNDIPVYRIYVVGMGNAPIETTEEGKVRRSTGGTVEVAVLKNDLGSLQTQGAPAAEGSTPPSAPPQSPSQGTPDSPK